MFGVLVSCCVLGLLSGCAQEALSPGAQTGGVVDEEMRGSGLNPELTAPLYDEPTHLVRMDAPQPARLRAETQAKRDGANDETTNSRQVPEFSVMDSEGTTLNSESMLGDSPVAVVFFASWCELCARKMPLIRRALEKAGGVKTMWVAVDGEQTQSHIPGFMREQRLAGQPYVMGLDHPDFVEGYNPMSSIPLVVVVGRSGNLIDYQVGLQRDDGPRLEAALVSAKLH